MSLGRELWLLITIKLLIIFAVIKLFFLPDYLNSRCTTENEKADLVLNNLIAPMQVASPKDTY